MNLVLCGLSLIMYCVLVLYFFRSGTKVTEAGDPYSGNLSILNIQLGI